MAKLEDKTKVDRALALELAVGYATEATGQRRAVHSVAFDMTQAMGSAENIRLARMWASIAEAMDRKEAVELSREEIEDEGEMETVWTTKYLPQ